ncbi:hypothetical protein FA15DRAFT_73148 [Coprinopsis marcescibilis]|uniref:Uncharacterized protein n=1 Tax=Coprinopsis marcescibilis TaxID=230819 RepID=A0A5C3KNF9_COPMA|nr:hypothetical protein FA15DRAFT_73148 [Coprinopsis marcescibilis]
MSDKTDHTPQPPKHTSATDGAPKDREGMEFSDAISSNGITYQVGVKVLDAGDSPASASATTHVDIESEPHPSDDASHTVRAFRLGDSDWVPVEWPIETRHVYTPPDVFAETHIRFYTTKHDRYAWIYPYEVQVSTARPGKYMFRDAEGDEYSLHVTGATYFLGPNVVNLFHYNSKQPEIRAVRYQVFETDYADLLTDSAEMRY